MAAALSYTEQLVEAAGLTVEVRRGGAGVPLLVLHGELGVPGWLEAHQHLSESFDVIVPSLPGYGRTTRPDWIMGARDLAVWVTWFARDLELPMPLNLIGGSLGGWVAAEIATIAPQFIHKMVLVGAMGIKPDNGEIFDYFLESGATGLRRAFHRPDDAPQFIRHYGKDLSQEALDVLEQHREMTCRIAWKPYMHSLTLRHLLPAIDVPTLLVWGANDAIIPLESGEIYQRGIERSKLVVIEECGHMPDIEKPAAFSRLVQTFLQNEDP